jgi:hypothetical protein
LAAVLEDLLRRNRFWESICECAGGRCISISNRSGLPAIVSRALPYVEVKLRLSEQKALAVAILLEGMAIFILIVVFTYYAVQAEASMKSDSPWKLRLDTTWKEAWRRYKARGLRAIPHTANLRNSGCGTVAALPFGEIVIAVCFLVFAAFNSALTSWYERF